MNRNHAQAPLWLFSFVDLSLLMLVALVQFDIQTDAPALDLRELVVPRIDTSTAPRLDARADERWQVRVHPPEAAAEGIYELVGVAEAGPPTAVLRLDRAGLRDRLSVLRDASREKPLLAPHTRSRSGDMLAAIAVIEDLWPGPRRATIAAVSAGP